MKMSWNGFSYNVGDFTFELEGNLLQKVIKFLRSKNNLEEKYEDIACDMMAKHYAFYEELNKVGTVKEEEYVTREATIHCDKGSNDVKLDAYEDHGILAANGKPLMTCNDCEVNKNIYSFGTCKCGDIYSESLPHPNEEGEPDAHGNVRYKCMPVLCGSWKQETGDLLIAEGEEFVEALRSGAFLTCIYGGKIIVIGIPEGKESEPEELPWIPSDILQLEGETKAEKNLKKWIDHLNGGISNPVLEWNQDKITNIWEACREYYEENSVQVDPRLLLAIIAKEGTGSFNTSSKNKAGDGGNGVELNFENDCDNAVNFLGGKIITYIVYNEAFSKAREEAYNKGYAGIKDYDDILHYINWETPRLLFSSDDSKIFESGVYADDNNWNSGVRQIYSELVHDNVTAEYTEYVKGLKKDILKKIANREGIDVRKKVDFEASQKGMDSKRKPNQEYVVIGIIYDKS